MSGVLLNVPYVYSNHKESVSENKDREITQLFESAPKNLSENKNDKE